MFIKQKMTGVDILNRMGVCNGDVSPGMCCNVVRNLKGRTVANTTTRIAKG